jgi:hypothetical protein
MRDMKMDEKKHCLDFPSDRASSPKNRETRSAFLFRKQLEKSFISRSVGLRDREVSSVETRAAPAQLRVAFAHASHTLFRRCLL